MIWHREASVCCVICDRFFQFRLRTKYLKLKKCRLETDVSESASHISEQWNAHAHIPMHVSSSLFTSIMSVRLKLLLNFTLADGTRPKNAVSNELLPTHEHKHESRICFSHGRESNVVVPMVATIFSQCVRAWNVNCQQRWRPSTHSLLWVFIQHRHDRLVSKQRISFSLIAFVCVRMWARRKCSRHFYTVPRKMWAENP